MARKVWKYNYGDSELQGMVRKDILSLILSLLRNMLKREVDFVVTAWKEIWHARNKFIFEGKKLSPITLIAKAKATIEAYQRAHETKQINRRDDVSKQKQWCPPPIGYYKVNVDATVQAGGAIYRNRGCS